MKQKYEMNWNETKVKKNRNKKMKHTSELWHAFICRFSEGGNQSNQPPLRIVVVHKLKSVKSKWNHLFSEPGDTKEWRQKYL